MYTDEWSQWITRLQASLGERELAEIIYVASQHYQNRRASSRSPASGPADGAGKLISDSLPSALFGDQEGRIAKANIGRDPLFFFAALQRQLNYPSVPRTALAENDKTLAAFLEARLNKIEQRLKIAEMEMKGGIDLTRFYKHGETDISKIDG